MAGNIRKTNGFLMFLARLCGALRLSNDPPRTPQRHPGDPEIIPQASQEPQGSFQMTPRTSKESLMHLPGTSRPLLGDMHINEKPLVFVAFPAIGTSLGDTGVVLGSLGPHHDALEPAHVAEVTSDPLQQCRGGH